eukprot:gene5827-6112_t
MPPGMGGATSRYAADFGVDGSDPLRRSAPTEHYITRMSTTCDLAQGTTGTTNHRPGAKAVDNTAKAVDDTNEAVDDRMNEKHDMLQYSLDQYNGGLPRSYGGHRPKVATRSGQGGATETVWGDASHR